MIPKHKIFLSFHSEDIAWKNRFEKLFHHSAEVVVSRSVQEHDIPDGLNTETVRQRIRDEYLRDSTVTVVLIGCRTWQRKHVDWEISSSLRHTSFNRRSGLIGIFLPDANNMIVPPRLHDNIANGYAKLYHWTDDPESIKEYVHEAFKRKELILPNNSRVLYANNRTTDNW